MMIDKTLQSQVIIVLHTICKSVIYVIGATGNDSSGIVDAKIMVLMTSVGVAANGNNCTSFVT